MLDLRWKAMGEALYSQDTAVTAVKMAIILGLWGAARFLSHKYGEKPPKGMGFVEAVRRGKMRPTKSFLALPHPKRRLVRGAERTIYTVLTVLGALFVLTYFQIL